MSRSLVQHVAGLADRPLDAAGITHLDPARGAGPLLDPVAQSLGDGRPVRFGETLVTFHAYRRSINRPGCVRTHWSYGATHRRRPRPERTPHRCHAQPLEVQAATVLARPGQRGLRTRCGGQVRTGRLAVFEERITLGARRSPPLHGVRAHLRRCERQAGSDRPRTFLRGAHAAGLRAPMAGR